MKKRVVITGMGAITSVGNDVKTLEENIFNGVSGIGVLDKFDPIHMNVKIAGQIKNFNPDDYILKRDRKRLDLASIYAIAASKEAYENANLEGVDPEDIGCMIGTGMGGIKMLEDDLEFGFANDFQRFPPLFVPKVIANMPSGNTSIALNLQGPNVCIVTACASGLHSIINAYKTIVLGDCPIVIAGGTEAAITRSCVAGFNALKALSTNPDPLKASRPFDKNRDGFVISEGAGMLVLEDLDHALARNATIYGEIVGYGETGDAYHMTAPNGVGAVKAMQKALKSANLTKEDIGYINAHGTSTPLNEKFEGAAIKTIFDGCLDNVKVSSTKSMTGHALGAVGAIEAIICLQALNRQEIPPTINYETKDEEIEIDIVANTALKHEFTYALNNSLGFGGHNAVAIFKKWENK